jgi:hypothetical protein
VTCSTCQCMGLYVPTSVATVDTSMMPCTVVVICRCFEEIRWPYILPSRWSQHVNNNNITVKTTIMRPARNSLMLVSWCTCFTGCYRHLQTVMCYHHSKKYKVATVHSIKEYGGGAEVQFQSFLTLVIVGSEWSTSGSGRFTPGK